MYGYVNLLVFLIIVGPTAHEPLNSNHQTHHHGRDNKGIPKQTLENWASNFGGQMFQFGVSVTKYNELHARFSTSPDSDVQPINLANLIVDMVKDINENLEKKVEAIRKIMDWAESKALEFYTEKKPPPPATYYNSKKFNHRKHGNNTDNLYHIVDLNFDKHFGNHVNTSFSSVHVPTSIYEKKDDVLESIGWSANLDNTFVSNYKLNPTLSYQYFGSATGFLRHYPAMSWPNTNSDVTDPDLYDCRTRPWYVQAANTPKNMFILHDVSGSMTGIRREIAKHVVNSLLDTLTENDYVNVYNFSDVTTPVVNCFRNKLVQANLENVRELKVGLEQDHTAGIANFTSALNTAFDVLEKTRREKAGSDCNQAIMIITDGAPFYFEEIFTGRQNPEHYVRVFTYLIGREVTEKREVLQMACANRGYFTHVSTLSEVQEKVLKYMPVMSRPMVIYKRHEESWSPVYAHIADTKETDWSWLDYNAKLQYNRSRRYKTLLRTWVDNPSFLSEHEHHAQVKRIQNFLDLQDYQDEGITPLAITAKKLDLRLKSVHGFEDSMEEHFPTPIRPKDPTEPFNFIISSSIPVFDNRNSTIVYKKVRVNDTHTFDKPIEERIAIFLGVAATDIPIKELKHMASPFQLGVNGYSFMINNNGYVVFHPDWRPVFKGQLLKPNYNTVDLTEVELVDRDDNVRNNDSALLEMRAEMIDEDRSYKKNIRVRNHQDDFVVDDVVKDAVYEPRLKLRVRKIGEDYRRVTIRRQVYEYHKLRNTPYTLAIAIPDNAHRFVGQMEIRLQSDNVISYFETHAFPRKWKINPDWNYCEFVRGGEKHPFSSNEDKLIYFLNKMQQSTGSWSWKNTGVGVKHRHQAHQSAENRLHSDSDIYECEKELVQSLVFDANVTKIFNEMNLWKFNKNDKELLKINGATSAFIATRTGLTRWMDFTDKQEVSNTTSTEFTSRFIEGNSGATGELWYKRAVDRYEYDPDSFVYTVPFDAGTRTDSRVTATRAIFVKKDGMQAPVAVVGVQFSHEKWATRFFEITSGLFDPRTPNESPKTCGSGEFDCFVLDDNGFILVSETHADTGKFFGEVDGMVMEMLVNSDVYKRVRVVDYQAVCFQPVSKANFASIIYTPFSHLRSLVTWMLAQLASALLYMNVHSFSTVLGSMSEDPPHTVVEDEIGYTLPPYIELAAINKTRLRPCDKETYLYTYGSSYNTHNFSYHGLLTKCGHSGCDGYFNAHYIPHTNLILLVTDGKCRCGMNSTSIKQKEVIYDKNKQEETEPSDLLLSSSPVEVCRTPKHTFHRKKPAVCTNYNPEEEYLKEDCGSSSALHPLPSIVLVLLAAIAL